MKIIQRFLFLVILGLTGCQAPTNTPQISNISIDVSTSTPVSFVFPTSNSNEFATIKGNLLVLDISLLPNPDDGIYLVPLDNNSPISTIPAFEDVNIFQATVNEVDGEFVFVNIPIGKYAVVILTRNGAQIPASQLNSTSMVIFDVKDSDLNNVIDLGNITFP
ncbi:MAG: hypothetical protein CL609_09320 [Anaerolineaceae bacterium]|nr:hypothetical protein [Anaerolineaceae bacterium]